MKKIFLLALSCLLLTACNIDLPSIESCFIGNASPSGDLVGKKELSPVQLKPLSVWFAGLGGDWKFKIVDNFPSGLVLVLNHQKDRTTRVNLRGDQLWIGNRFRVLTPSEREELLALVSEKNQLPVFGQ
jgi:hypothetical protein